MEHANSNDNARRKAEHVRKAKILKAAMADPKLNATDFRVLSILAEIANSLTGKCFPSHDTIGEKCGLTDESVRKATYRLRGAGYLQWETSNRPVGKGKQNHYELHLPDDDSKNDADHRDINTSGKSNGESDHWEKNTPTTGKNMPRTTGKNLGYNLSESEPFRDNLSDNARSLRSRAAHEGISDDIFWEKIGGDLTKEQCGSITAIIRGDPAYGKKLKQEAIKAERRKRGEGCKRILHLAQHWQRPPAGETEDDSPPPEPDRAEAVRQRHRERNQALVADVLARIDALVGGEQQHAKTLRQIAMAYMQAAPDRAGVDMDGWVEWQWQAVLKVAIETEVETVVRFIAKGGCKEANKAKAPKLAVPLKGMRRKDGTHSADPMAKSSGLSFFARRKLARIPPPSWAQSLDDEATKH